MVAWNADDTLNIVKGVVARIDENHYIAAFRRAEVIRDLVDQNIFTIMEGRLHTLALNRKWLQRPAGGQEQH
jgi:hypothetical protein